MEGGRTFHFLCYPSLILINALVHISASFAQAQMFKNGSSMHKKKNIHVRIFFSREYRFKVKTIVCVTHFFPESIFKVEIFVCGELDHCLCRTVSYTDNLPSKTKPLCNLFGHGETLLIIVIKKSKKVFPRVVQDVLTVRSFELPAKLSGTEVAFEWFLAWKKGKLAFGGKVREIVAK